MRYYFLPSILSLLFGTAACLGTTLDGPEFPVNTTTTGNQFAALVAGNESGQFVVFWRDAVGGVFGQRYSASGLAQGSEFFAASGDVYPRDAAMSETGAFVVVMNQDNGSEWDVSARAFDSAGNPRGAVFSINSYTTGNQVTPRIDMFDTGEFVIVWGSDQNGSLSVFGQRFAADATPIDAEFQVNSMTTQGHWNADVSALSSSGDFVVTWLSYTPAGSEQNVMARRFRFGHGGGPPKSEFAVTTSQTDNLNPARVDASLNDDFVVVWESSDGLGYNVFGQRFDTDGDAVGGEFAVNMDTPGYQA